MNLKFYLPGPTIVCALGMFFNSAVNAAAPESVPLWPEGAPEAKGTEPKDVPRVEIFPAAKEKSCGAGVVVLPGGGYGGLAADHEAGRSRSFTTAWG
ncbi:hypothetical protein [Verrucomicrobium spinosum]|uniref:hypothetical protein n=1 Tax=Verrucomicrobium spinosum TaxID=2736 RepID=UPI000AB8149B|nr:hypothetical protein [Verrucomicrobium spinosum]